MKFNTQSMCPIEGEANVARFLFRLLGAEPQDPIAATQMDCWIDTAVFLLAEGGSKERATVLRSLNAALGRSPWLLGQEFSLADIVCACCVLRAGQSTSAPANAQRWLKACQNLGHFDCVYPLLQWRELGDHCRSHSGNWYTTVNYIMVKGKCNVTSPSKCNLFCQQTRLHPRIQC